MKFLPRRQYRYLYLLVALLPLAAFLIYLSTRSDPKAPEPIATAEPPQQVEEAPPPPAPEPRFAPLTGVPLSEEEYQALRYQRPIGVMLDNVSLAQPQSGIDRADIVIEAMVEGGITRDLAIYHSTDADYIEPVRSARTPFLYWALEYDAMFAHVGSAEKAGDANAGGQIIDWNVSDLDFEGGLAPARTAFERNPNRVAPHNVRTSTQRMRAEGASRGYEHEFDIWPWQFSGEVGPGVPANSVAVGFGGLSPYYTPRWDWDPAAGYVRSQYGGLQRDGYSGLPVTVANVIVLYADAWVADSSGHVLYELIGEGRAQVFRNGQMYEGFWRKGDAGQRTRFYTLDGQEMQFAPGKSWIEVVSLSGGTSVQ